MTFRVTAWPEYTLPKPEPYLCKQRAGNRAELPVTARFLPEACLDPSRVITLLLKSSETMLTKPELDSFSISFETEETVFDV